MKKKFLVILSVLLLTCCALFSFSITASAQTVIKTPGSLEITSSYAGNQRFMFYKNKLHGEVTVEFDYKPNAWNAKIGFGLISDTASDNPYSSRMFYVENNANGYFTPWATSFVETKTPWQNYDEGYAGTYKMFQKVRIKMVVNSNGDTTLYAKSIEDPSTYSASSKPQQTEYVQVSDTISGLFATELANEGGYYFALFFGNGASSSYYYGLTIKDTVATYVDDQTAENLSDNYILTTAVNTGISDGTLVYTPAVTEEIEELPEHREGALVLTPSYAQDGMINHKVKVSGAMDIYLDVDITGLNNFGFGLMATSGDTSPYSSRLFFASKTSIFTPWASAYIGSAKAYLNGYTISGRTTLRLNLNENGDATLYAGETKILDTVEGLYANEVANGGYFCMFARAGSANGYVYSVKINDANGVKLDRIDFAYNILNTANFVFTASINSGLGSVVYWQEPLGSYIPGVTATLDVSAVETVVNEGESIDLTPAVLNKAETDVLTVKVNGEVISDYNHTFVEEGTYTVTYFVTDKDGKDLDSASLTVTVNKLIATLDVSAITTSLATGKSADLTPVIINKEETDVLTVKVNGEVITDYNYTFAVAGEYTVEYTVANADGEELDSAVVTVTVVDTEGALVFTKNAGNDGMIDHNVKVSGAMDIYVDIELGGISYFGFGLMSNFGDTSPYGDNSNLFMVGANSIWAPWGSKLVPNATAYNDDYTFSGRTTLRMNVTQDGDVTIYAGDVQLYDTFVGVYAKEVKGSYFCMFARAGSANGYVYSVKINDANGVKLDRIDFVHDILNTENFAFTEAIKNGLGNIVYWQEPTGEYIPKVTATLDVSAVETVINEGESVDLTPVVLNKAETDVLTVKVNGEVISDYNHTFVDVGTYTVTYFVTDKDGKDLDSASLTVTVNKLIATLDVSAITTSLATGKSADLTPVIINKKETDVLTVKVNGEVITDYNYTFAVAGEYTVEYIVANADGEELDSAVVTVTVADTEGALVFVPGYANDGMINNKVKLSGAMNIYIDIDVTGFSEFGFGIMETYGDSSPYNSNLLFASKTGVYSPWGDPILKDASNKYLNDYVLSGRVMLMLSINANGDVELFADGVKILDKVEGLFADEVNGGYFCMFARVGEENGYVYSVRITDANGNRLHKLDFDYDILSKDNFHFTTAVEVGLGTILYWQEPTGQYVPVPTAEISVSNVATSVNQGKAINLTPTISNMAQTDVLTVTVDGKVIDSLEYTFEETGNHTVVYTVVNAEGVELDKATVTVFVKANSTQNNAETNFNQGYFDGRDFEATAGVAVTNGTLLIKSTQTALFTTVGNSENFILTFEIASYVSGEIKVVFGYIDGNEYSFTFLSNGKVKFGEVEYEINKNIYQILNGGNKVTVRVKVFGGNATLYLRASNESVENIEVALLSVKDILVVGKVGFGGENVEFTADNVKFVNLTSIDEDNTYYPSDEELNPDIDDEEESSESTVKPESKPSTSKKGCFGSVSASAVFSLLTLVGIVYIKRKKN